MNSIINLLLVVIGLVAYAEASQAPSAQLRCDTRYLNYTSDKAYVYRRNARGQGYYMLVNSWKNEKDPALCESIPQIEIYARYSVVNGKEVINGVHIRALKKVDIKSYVYWNNRGKNLPFLDDHYKMYGGRTVDQVMVYPAHQYYREDTPGSGPVGYHKYASYVNFYDYGYKYTEAYNKYLELSNIETDPNVLKLQAKDPKCKISISLNILTRELTIEIPKPADEAKADKTYSGLCWDQ